ncbi:MAG: type II secretion system major pseudopilin GspG [Firmicutes bacterium]|nr:type II secretion system major pseudopilin GspG [Bacillota bacterium]
MFHKKRSEQGYTLLEVVAVLTLLAALMTLVTPNIIREVQKGQVKAAKAQLQTLKNVLNSYYLDNSSYPTTEQGLRALIEKPTIPPIPDNWNGPYLEDRKIPRDPWGQELRYLAPGMNNPDRYDVFSYGNDKKEGGEGNDADIGNWEN